MHSSSFPALARERLQHIRTPYLSHTAKQPTRLLWPGFDGLKEATHGTGKQVGPYRPVSRPGTTGKTMWSKHLGETQRRFTRAYGDVSRHGSRHGNPNNNNSHKWSPSRAGLVRRLVSPESPPLPSCAALPIMSYLANMETAVPLNWCSCHVPGSAALPCNIAACACMHGVMVLARQHNEGARGRHQVGRSDALVRARLAN
jgi:hypothetical protein